MAFCYEELNQLEEAARLYREALQQEPHNTYYLGGYCSFLCWHGEPQEALVVYLDYIAANGFRQSEIDSCMSALKTLAARIGLSDGELEKRLRETR